jgi:hypothetical protein
MRIVHVSAIRLERKRERKRENMHSTCDTETDHNISPLVRLKTLFNQVHHERQRVNAEDNRRGNVQAEKLHKLYKYIERSWECDG